MLLVQDTQQDLSGWSILPYGENVCQKGFSGQAPQGLVARVWISDFKFKEKPSEILNGNGMLRLHI